MITNYTENNYLVLIGKIISDKTFSHEIYGESFYVFNLEVPRLSGNEDIIPITISERLIANFDLTIGRKVVIEGQFRSYNSYENEKQCESKLPLEYKKLKSDIKVAIEKFNVAYRPVEVNGSKMKEILYGINEFQ